MALAFLIYDLNKCSVSMADQNVKECSKLMEVCRSIVKHQEEYLNLYETLPTKAITEQMEKINIRETANADNKENETNQKGMVQKMKELEDLRIILVQLVTAAKSDNAGAKMSVHFEVIGAALKEYKWDNFKSGTTFLA